MQVFLILKYLYNKTYRMSLERIKEVMSVVCENVTLSATDIETLKAQPTNVQKSLLKALGSYSKNQADANDAYNSFLNKSGVSDRLNVDGGSEMFDGDDDFKKNIANGIENADVVVEFFSMMYNLLADKFRNNTSFRFHDVKVISKTKIYVYLSATGNKGEYETKRNEFNFYLEDTSSGGSKIKSIRMNWVEISKEDDAEKQDLYVKLNSNNIYKVITTGPVNNHTITFK